MLKTIFKLFTLFFLILASLTILKINHNNKISYNYINNILVKYNHKKDDIIGYIKIDKINLKEKLYKIESPENEVDKNITILKESIIPPNDKSNIYIAAHSGTGKTAFFDKLNHLTTNDIVILYLYNKEYIYTVKDIWNEYKNGYIYIPQNNESNLILTTCNPNKEKLQLIISCTKKES